MALWPFGRKHRKSDALAEKTTLGSKSVKRQQLSRAPVGHGGDSGYGGEFEVPQEKQRSFTTPVPVGAQNSKRRGRANSASPVPSLPLQISSSPETPERFKQRKRSTSDLPQTQPRSPSVLKKPNPYYNPNTATESSLQVENITLTALPTLRNSKSVQENRASRHKSSKRKEEQRLRALEVKAMSTPIPIPKRPQSIGTEILAKDSKRVPGGLNRRLERPLSEVSLPMVESLRSSMSDPAVMHSFKISAFDALSPRPTIKYAEHPRGQTIALGGARKEKRPLIPDEDFHTRKRIDELADDLDANGLRQLLERDQRRRERKRRSHQAELQRKLDDRLEQHVEDDRRDMDSAQEYHTRRENGQQSDHSAEHRDEPHAELPANLQTESPADKAVDEAVDEAVELPAESLIELPAEHRRKEHEQEHEHQLENERIDLEMDPEPEAEHELDLPMDQALPPALGSKVSKPRGPVRKPSWLDDASKEYLPVEDSYDDHVAESFLEDATSADDREEAVVRTATAVRLSQASMSPPTPPIRSHPRDSSNISNFTNLGTIRVRDLPDQAPLEVVPRVQPEMPERGKTSDGRRDSDMSGRLAGSWTSFFRRSGIGRSKPNSTDKDRTTPPEFANASRDSPARQPAPPPIPARSFRRSGAKARTHSRFKEDLPELPISPPAPRIQSHDLGGHSSPYIDRSATVSAFRTGGLVHSAPLSYIHPAFRDEGARSRGHSLRGTSPEVPSPNILSPSLASVDSEGSWLSGKPSHKRSSVHANPLRSSAGSLSQHMRDSPSADDNSRAISRTDAGLDDAYFTRRDPTNTLRAAPSGLTSQFHADDLDGTLDAGPDAPYSDDGESRMLAQPRSVPEPFTINTVVDRHPTIVRRQQIRAKSCEGLLDDFQNSDAAENKSPVSPGSPNSLTSPVSLMSPVSIASPGSFSDAVELPIQGRSDGDNGAVHRATSVEYGSKGGHARHMSAGSVRLLDLTPRSSREQKRLSGASLGRSLLGRDDGNTTRSASLASGVAEEADEGK